MSGRLADNGEASDAATDYDRWEGIASRRLGGKEVRRNGESTKIFRRLPRRRDTVEMSGILTSMARKWLDRVCGR